MRNREEVQALLAALLVAVFSSGAPAFAATTLYVDQANTSCSDSGVGSASQPFCTIGAAAARATAGQTVVVASGTYRENVTPANSGTSGAAIVFMAAAGASVTVTGQTSGFTLSSRSWITVQGFNVTQTTGDGISVSSASHVTITGNHTSYCGQPVSGKTAHGIRLSGTTDSLVSGNTVDHNTDHGIYLSSASTRVTVDRNQLFANAQGFQRAAAGIDSYGSTANTFSNNVSHDNEDSGIDFRGSANNNLVFNNVCYHNGDHGIDVLASTGMRIVANSVYGSVTSGINVEGNSSGATIANNISVDNGINSPRTMGNIRVDGTSTSGTNLDYDLVFLHQSSPMIVWGSTSYSSLASFVAATGQETHGIQADPRWQSTSGGDFHLTAGSPAIDSANSGASGQSTTDADGNPRVDDPATPNTGAGPRSYDDRGAYEYQPTGGDAPPAAALTVSPASGPVPLAVTADASGSTDTDATPIATYTFDFGDGATVGPQAGPTATHTYNAAGTFVVTVTVRDTAGLASSAGAQVTVTAGPDNPPAASLAVRPASGTAPLAVTADATGSSDTDATPIASYTFDFGDGTAQVGPQAGATASHTYARFGTFVVTVTVTDTAGLSSSAGTQVTVADGPPAAALTVTPSSGTAPLAVTASASGSTDNDGTPIATYRFDFGDGSAPVGPQSGATSSHTYTALGTFTVTVTVTDTAGLASTVTRQVTVTDAPPSAALTVSPSAGATPLTVQADASASRDSDPTPIATYTFTFGDGTAAVGPQSTPTASHTYTSSGNFTVTVVVRDTGGLSSTASARVHVGKK